MDDFLRLPDLSSVITDSHFVARDRMGRHLTFLARIVNDGSTPQAKGIAVDEKHGDRERDGKATLYGDGAAYFTRTNGKPQVCAKNLPLTYKNVSVTVCARAGRSTSTAGRARAGPPTASRRSPAC